MSLRLRKLLKLACTDVLYLPVSIRPLPLSFTLRTTCTFPYHSRRCEAWRWNTGPISLQTRCHTTSLSSGAATLDPTPESPLALLTTLPKFKSCPGCGALVQNIQPEEAGYFSASRKAVKLYLRSKDEVVDPPSPIVDSETEVFKNAIRHASGDTLESLGMTETGKEDTETGSPSNNTPELPLCDRCHHLLHHRSGVSIIHPSIDSIEEIISESPFKHNHIYHVLDAADFPLSLVPRIHKILDLAPQRSKNRRSKHAGYRHGRKAELSFIITRSDLLAPKKEQVDSLMPYLVEVLRDALGSAGKDVRLGNIHCVSAKRDWWTKELKADIWQRGGGGWMVGKVNVGKSKLFEVVFPKGRSEDVNFDVLRNKVQLLHTKNERHERREDELVLEEFSQKTSEEDNYLLPPARPETAYPVMPIVSSLPGTTASPIRIPFGGGRGELIDLPGLARGNLESFVRPVHRGDLVMTVRVSPEQYVIKPGQSLLLAGLIRIDNINHDTIILAYPFVPLKPHVTSIEKAKSLRLSDLRVHLVVERTMTEVMARAAKVQLRWDVTKQRAGPLTARSAAGLKTSTLAFRVLSTDVLIESVGWVELVAQVRKRRSSALSAQQEIGADPLEASYTDRALQQLDDVDVPEVEVYSPEGKFIGVRRPMGAWLLGDLDATSKKGTKGRPRRAMASFDRRN